MRFAATPRALLGLAILAGGLALGPIPGPTPARAQTQEVPQSSLEDAIGDCVNKEGATGGAVGDITIDLKTGRVVYRCDSDAKGDEKVITSGKGAGAKTEAGAAKGSTTAGGTASPTAPGAKPDTPQGDTAATTAETKPEPVENLPPPDHGAAAAYVNTPRGPAPDRPEDCVGAHPYYMTFPVCVIARKMGLLGKPEAPATETATQQPAEGAPAPTQATAEGQGQAAPSPAQAAAPMRREIGPLPEDAAEAAARASEKVAAQIEGENAAMGEDGAPSGPMGTVSGGREEDFDWVGLLIWIGVGLGGLLAVGLVALGGIVLVNRARMKRQGEEDDPFAAYFDDPDDLLANAEDEDDLGDAGEGLFGGVDMGADEDPLAAFANDAPLSSFDEDPHSEDDGEGPSKTDKTSVDASKAFTA